MVLVEDESGTFEAPLPVVWKFLQSPEEHGRVHRQRKGSLRLLSENQVLAAWEQEVEGAAVKVSNRITLLPPLGFAVEVLEGPFAGSKFFNYYLPRGERTEVLVVGDFVSKSVPEEEVPAAVHRYLAEVFREDEEALRRKAGVGR